MPGTYTLVAGAAACGIQSVPTLRQARLLLVVDGCADPARAGEDLHGRRGDSRGQHVEADDEPVLALDHEAAAGGRVDEALRARG